MHEAPLEESYFCATTWPRWHGVEKLLQGPLDTPVDGYEAWRLRLHDHPPPPPPLPQPGGPAVYYLLETTVPDNWIPLVPVQTPSGQLLLRRG